MRYRGIEINQENWPRWWQFETDEEGGVDANPSLELCKLHVDDMLQEWEVCDVTYIRPGSVTGLPETARDIPVSRIVAEGYRYNDHNIVPILKIEKFTGYRPPQDMVTLFGMVGTE